MNQRDKHSLQNQYTSKHGVITTVELDQVVRRALKKKRQNNKVLAVLLADSIKHKHVFLIEMILSESTLTLSADQKKQIAKDQLLDGRIETVIKAVSWMSTKLFGTWMAEIQSDDNKRLVDRFTINVSKINKGRSQLLHG